MKELLFAVIGAGFWARYQLAAWKELPGARCVALCDLDQSKAQSLAASLGVPRVYQDADEMVRRERLDFLDIITDVDTHGRFVQLAAAHRIPVICQKPLASSLEEARKLASICKEAEVTLSVHENWRWQAPIRVLKSVLDSGVIGPVFRARIDYCNSFPVFDNQPFLKNLKQFILVDMGTHILDAARFLFGDADRLYCQLHRVHSEIKGEDAATVVMRMRSDATVTCNLSYASRMEQDRFPETFVLVEGENGSVELAPDFWVRVTTSNGTESRRHPPPFFAWADPRYALVQSSIVACHVNLLRGLRTGVPAETTAEDNLKTLELVFASYASAASGHAVNLKRYA
ncbi:MAG: Gfo/Idh/MocA family oxidoreductase [Verrucomicrobia bacterium]|nr:Gfo/Idh/MocA family oxidoreductase [Verrucomicrobiota bacterium]